MRLQWPSGTIRRPTSTPSCSTPISHRRQETSGRRSAAATRSPRRSRPHATRCPPGSTGSSSAGTTSTAIDSVYAAGVELIHTCYRITDPERSVAFYEALGFEKRRELPIRDEAVNYFLGIPGHEQPELELTHNFGVDSYELGTAYGHIAVTVDDIEEALSALAEKGIEPEKPPYSVREGGSLIAFVRDPDGYRVELIERV